MVTITLPRLIGARPAVGPFMVGVPGALEHEDVELDCRKVLIGTPSFADEVVAQVLVARRAERLLVVGAHGEFAVWLAESATEQGVQDRLVFRFGV